MATLIDLHDIVRDQRQALEAEDYAAFKACLARRAEVQRSLVPGGPTPDSRQLAENILAMDLAMEALLRRRLAATEGELRSLATGKQALSKYRPGDSGPAPRYVDRAS